jgi:Domain of unknown function DUF29
VKANNSSRVETLHKLEVRCQEKESEYKSLKDYYEAIRIQEEEQVIYQFNPIINYAEKLMEREMKRLREQTEQLKTDIEYLPVLSDTVSCPKKEELRNQLILLMISIINWKEFPDFKNSEWATSITKGRHVIEDLRLKNSSLDENYINHIWNVCFKRAKHLVKAEIGAIKRKDQRVNSLNWKEVFEDDYTLSFPKSNYFSKTLFVSESLPILMSFDALFFAFSVALYTLDSISFGKMLAPFIFNISLGLLIPICFIIAASNNLLKWSFFIMFCLVSTLFVIITSSQPPKPITSTVPQSSASVKPSPSPNPGFTEPLKNSQSIHQKENK